MSPALRRIAFERGLLVVVLAILVRLWVWWDVQDAPFWLVPSMDEIAYLRMSDRVLQGMAPEYGAWYMTPGYAWFLAGVAKLGGQIPQVKLLQMFMGVVSSWLLFALGRRAFDLRVGLLAGALWALAPFALLHEVLVLKPALTLLLALLGSWALLRPAAGLRWWALAGLAFGAASLMRGEMLVVAVALAVAGAVALRRGAPCAPRSLAGPIAMLALVAALVAVPTAQNVARGGGFVLIAFGGGPNFYIGNHAGADGSYLALRPDRSDALFEAEDAVTLAREASPRALDAAGVSRFWTLEGLKWWAAEPQDALALTAHKAVLLWSAWEGNDVFSLALASRWVAALANPVVRPVVLLPLGLAGLVLLRRGFGRRWPLVVFVVASWLSLTPFFVFERFRLPMVAVATVFAAAAIVAAFDGWRHGARGKVALASLLTVLLAFALTLPRVERDENVLRVNIGSMLMEQGRWEEALAEFEAVRRGSPEVGRVQINIGTALHGLGRDEEALAALGRALDHLYAEARGTGRPAVEELRYCHELSATIEREQNRPERARRHYEAILRLTPGDARIRRELERLGS